MASRCGVVFGAFCILLMMSAGGKGAFGRTAAVSSLSESPFSGMEVIQRSDARGKLASELYEGNPDLGKISSHLLEARRLLGRKKAVQRETLQPLQGIIPPLPMSNGLLNIEIRLRTLTPEIVERLRALGAEIQEVHYPFARIYALCAPGLLDEIAAIPEVRTIHANYHPYRNVGSVGNQADASMRAAMARLDFDVDGSGIDVGYLSDSFNDQIGGSLLGTGCDAVLSGSASQLSGNLPDTVILLENGPGGGTDEGAALAELAYDLAPGSGVMFHSAFVSAASMAEGIGELRDCGAEVILDDVIYFAEPMFQDGIIAQAAQAVVDDGVPYLSAAGNQGSHGVDEFYQDSNPSLDNLLATPNGDDFHDFGGGDRYAAISIPPGCTILLVLQWNEPFDGTLGAGAASDLDLYLCISPDPSDCLFGSASTQGCGFGAGVRGGDPLEIGGVVNNGSVPATIYTAVEHYCGNKNLRFRIVPFSLECGSSFPEDYGFEAAIFDQPTIYGHPAAADVMAVGAVFYGEIDLEGDLVSPTGVINVEPYSSCGGPLPFYFDGSGSPLPGAPVTRFKPEIVAPDGTNNSFLGFDIGFDDDGFPNFFGTSGSVAHAAAVVALMLDRNGSLPPDRISRVLMETARDIEQAGVDNVSGAGLIDAYSALEVVTTATLGVVEASETWVNQSLNLTYKQPVVVVGPPTCQDTDPGVARLRDPGPGGFDVRFQEWDYLATAHAAESIPYLVLEAGYEILADGTRIEAGTFSQGGTGSWSTQYFEQAFSAPPRVFLSIQSANDNQAVTARVRNVTLSSFQSALFEQQALMDGHAAEIVGYLAIDSPTGSGSLPTDETQMPYLLQRISLTDKWKQVGPVALKLEEEQSSDSEVGHVAENVDLLTLSGQHFAQISGFNESDPVALRQSCLDFDGDGCLDVFDEDDDNDGLPDAYEKAHGFDSLNPDDALLDADGDGETNLLEYQNGTDPLNPCSSMSSRRAAVISAIGLLLLSD